MFLQQASFYAITNSHYNGSSPHWCVVAISPFFPHTQYLKNFK